MNLRVHELPEVHDAFLIARKLASVHERHRTVSSTTMPDWSRWHLLNAPDLRKCLFGDMKEGLGRTAASGYPIPPSTVRRQKWRASSRRRSGGLVASHLRRTRLVRALGRASLVGLQGFGCVFTTGTGTERCRLREASDNRGRCDFTVGFFGF